MLTADQILDRDIFIIRYLRKGIPAAQLADDLGITRERVRQIYYNITGKNPKTIKEKNQKQNTILYRTRRHCLACGKKFFPSEEGGYYYCSEDCRKKMEVREQKIGAARTCYICGKKFMPFRNGKNIHRKASNRYFHNNDCFIVFLSYCNVVKGKVKSWQQ